MVVILPGFPDEVVLFLRELRVAQQYFAKRCGKVPVHVLQHCSALVALVVEVCLCHIVEKVCLLFRVCLLKRMRDTVSRADNHNCLQTSFPHLWCIHI